MKDCLPAEMPEDGSTLTFTIPKPLRPAYLAFHKKCAERFGGYRTIDQRFPSRPRTTGKYSQNNCTHGWADDLAKQADIEYLKDAGMMYRYLVMLAMYAGIWPRFELPDNPGLVMPLSESLLTIEQDRKFLEFVERKADEMHCWLTRIDRTEGKAIPYRSLYGMNRQEMREKYPEINGDKKT